ISLSASPIKNDLDIITGIAVIARDISERKMAEAEIADKNDDLKSAKKEIALQKIEREKRAAELGIANIELAFQDKEKGKRAEELIIANYARSLIEASLDPLFTISPEGKITDMNNASVNVIGISREKLIGTDFFEYFTEPDKAREGYQQVFAK
ncbi:MAG: PAS domain S-box protein, partial [Bacteroidetes bacterium]|nr:PAS domain S-box protein [Bacteroidota bacterium]